MTEMLRVEEDLVEIEAKRRLERCLGVRLPRGDYRAAMRDRAARNAWPAAQQL
ncbi:MAG TPA: hypothetical protein VMM15_40050 [Bradyrhizobium sp.]|nr:hypothetical protein [Bradyrhizobium sp.]